VLGWDEATVAREVDAYTARVDAERASQNEPSDETADARRRTAPEIRSQLVAG
jgi:glycerol-3-phosphate dehydrogenase